MTWRVRVRRFRCSNCSGRVFAEPMPGLGARKARRSDRLTEAQIDIDMVLGCERGARLSRPLFMPVRDPHLPADLVHRRTVLRLPQGEGDLFVREVFARHGIHPPSGFRMPEKLALSADQCTGSGSLSLGKEASAPFSSERVYHLLN